MCQPDSTQPGGRRRKKVIAIVGGLLLALVVVAVSLCCFFGIHSRQDLRAYAAMSRERLHPIWKDLALRRIRKGDTLESLLQKHRPTQREDFGPYTSLRYVGPGSSGTLQIRAKNARLIYACAGSECWEHVFFAAPEEEAAFSQACMEYWQQVMLERGAYAIHRTITTGQDVFLSRRVQRTQVRDDPNDPKYPAGLRQLREVYGQAYLDQFLTQTYLGQMLTHLELTVEVNEVLSGNLKPGMVLKFRGDSCENAGLDGPATIFLHVKDSRLFWSHSEGREVYTTTSRKALDWYRSLSPEEIKKLEALRQSGSTGTVRSLAIP